MLPLSCSECSNQHFPTPAFHSVSLRHHPGKPTPCVFRCMMRTPGQAHNPDSSGIRIRQPICRFSPCVSTIPKGFRPLAVTRQGCVTVPRHRESSDASPPGVISVSGQDRTVARYCRCSWRCHARGALPARKSVDVSTVIGQQD